MNWAKIGCSIGDVRVHMYVGIYMTLYGPTELEHEVEYVASGGCCLLISHTQHNGLQPIG